MTYSALYDRDSSLAASAGNFLPDTHVDPLAPGQFTGSISISGNGVIFEQDPLSQCVVNGQVNLIDTRFNAYEVSITFANCTDAYLTIDNSNGQFGPDPTIEVFIPNGTTLSGLGILDDSVLPEIFDWVLAGDLAGSGNPFALVISLTRQ